MRRHIYVKTAHQTSLIFIKSNLDRLESLLPTHGQRSYQQSRQMTLQSVLIDKPKFLKATRYAEIRTPKMPRSMFVEVLCWCSRLANEHPAVQSPVHPRKTPHESCPFAAHCWPSSEENRPWSVISFSVRNVPVRAFDSRAQGFSTP